MVLDKRYVFNTNVLVQIMKMVRIKVYTVVRKFSFDA